METVEIKPQSQTVDCYDDEEEYVESEDTYLMRMLNDDNVLKYIKMFHEFQLLDTHDALSIVVDLHDMEAHDIDMDCFGCFVLQCYNKHTLEGNTKQLKEVNRMSCSPDCYPFFHMTFTVVDELTKEEVTLQAQVIQYAIGQLQLGMLRDASHDRVLAAIRCKEHLRETLIVD
ncbi:ABC transporter A family member 12 [Bienertia sinuspersici]